MSSTTAIVVLTALWLAVGIVVWSWCVAAARADEAIRRGCASPDLPERIGPTTRAYDPRDWQQTAAWLNSAGELRIGPKPIAELKPFPCHYCWDGLHVYGRTLYEVADVMSRLESHEERA